MQIIRIKNNLNNELLERVSFNQPGFKKSLGLCYVDRFFCIPKSIGVITPIVV